MNIALPVSSEVESVDFQFLSADEIRAISVKRIENDSTFDSLLNPVPGGLYDPALGSWGDSPCTTCHLNHSTCPGHPGHIQLPVPVYHPVFMDQAYHLLRAICVYCKGFRMSTKDLHMYMCQLRLLQHGLIHEARTVSAIGDMDWADKFESPGPGESEAEEDGPIDSIIRKREKYVQNCLRGNPSTSGDAKGGGKHEGRGEMRRQVIKEFLSGIIKGRLCASCGGISPTYRRDRSVKVFERSLSPKEKAKMAQRGLKWNDATTRVYQGKPMWEPEATLSDESEAAAESLRGEGEDTQVDAVGPDHDVERSTPATVGPAIFQRYLSPMEVRARLVELFNKEQDLISLLYRSKPTTRSSPRVTPDMFFITCLLVPPNRYRPEARTGESQISEAQQNSLYKSILRGCTKIAQVYTALSEKTEDIVPLHEAWTELQEGVNALVDRNANPMRGAAAARNEDGIKQILEKKEGLFRKNLMGKRVNYAARSVISPDPNLETNEIGVPPVFARKLTYPEPVTSHNFRDMQQAVINGNDKWPGAFAIENEDGQIVSLRNKSLDNRISLANQLLAPSSTTAKITSKKVYRHLTNGDVVLMNRQPTLHKPSIMGHRVRVLPGEKTLRMHYANCNTYNADFDGDEMNMHFPQNEIARAEALQIADTDHQFLSGTQGKPLRGLIQDHISLSVALCSRDCFFSRGDYQQLIYSALRPESGHIFGERIQLVTPAIIKPVPRWTGKQVITTILKNIQPLDYGGLTMHGRSQTHADQWGPKSEEGTVLIEDGEFITGILDKAHIGHSSGGMIHAIHEIYGPVIAGKLLSSLGRLLTRYLNMRAFSCGIDDLRLTPEGEKSRRQELQSADHIGLKVASGYVSLGDISDPGDALLLERLEEVLRDDSKLEGLDLLMNSASKDITGAVQKACFPNSLEKPFPRNQMNVMTTSGAKGSRVNASLISCNLGQQVLESRRVPLMVSGKSLPCFKAFETNIRANGFITSRFLTGIRPHEYFFHHMAGREGLIDTAVKTSRSGYLQRCIIKGLEGLAVTYDMTVRDADGSLVQFLYGEDGLDVAKQDYLTNFSFILNNVASEAVQLKYGAKEAQCLGTHRHSFSKYMKSAIKHAKAGDPNGKDPLISAVNPATNAFATSESFYEAMSSYLKENPDGLIREKGNKTKKSLSLNRKNAETLFVMKYLRSLAEPGEAVGIVAGQSVGEPSTQMTLNTFHLAGHAARNVTQGIPRLREILMTAAKVISTPSMTLHPIEGLSTAMAEEFAKSISALPMSYILDDAIVEEKVGQGKLHGQAKMYRINLRFFPWEEYTKTYAIGISMVMDAVESSLIRHILAITKAEIKKRTAQATAATPTIGVKAGVVEVAAPHAAPIHEDGDARDDDDDDDDASNVRQRANRLQAVSYGPDDDESNETQEAVNKDDVTVGEMEGDGGEDSEGSAPPGQRTNVNGDEESAGHLALGRAERVRSEYAEVTDFECDETNGGWCSVTLEFEAAIPKLLMLNIVQSAIAKTVVREISNIGSCTLLEREDKKGYIINAEGVNLKAMQDCGDYIDPHRIETNDIAAVLSVYGVEACRRSIMRELASVFSSHGIQVDDRHLSLIADYMTRNGGFTAFSRMGLQGNASPFTKMSFETTLGFLRDAVLDGDWDYLMTPSSRLVMGRLGKLGTGSFDVLTRLPTYHVNALA
ncbi:DNA-directed RNA polymerase I subunit RPA1 [Fusarium albosuccineum]|uniref:DNA-directed RNA polymerase subunit n=1 Tax=Fusarium albosuccineum TaxID=1237068 RepID=A0A8H4LNR8_9HYPO|nr:DNA-directed RNA polymerase I subunit RPA1 [Fusarium albosuccineum]